MKTYHTTLKYKTGGFMHFLDITDDVQSFIDKNKVKNGFITIFSKHTTAAIRINEREKGITKDFKQFVEELLPADKYFRHNDLSIRTENLVCEPGASDCLNGHSHCLHILMGGTSEHAPIINGKMVFGTFQRIFLIELDCIRPRQVILHILGE